jgi:parvulin-like peptidyl-prolyl isomerase
MRSHFSSEKEFQAELHKGGTTLTKLKEDLLKRAKADFQVYRAVASRYRVTDSDAEQFEKESSSAGKPAVSFRLRRFGVPVGEGGQAAARDKVKQLLAKSYAEGKSFEQGVRKYSQVPGASEDSGDLGYLDLNELSPEVRSAVKDLQPGQASPPVIVAGYASIFYIEARRNARAILVERTFRKQREEMVAELRRKASLHIYDSSLLKKLPPEYKAIATASDAPAADDGYMAEPAPMPAKKSAFKRLFGKN